MTRRRGIHREGFTLVELMIVIAILAVVSSIVVAYTGDSTNDAKAAAVAHDLQAIARAAMHYNSLYERWPTSAYNNSPGEFETLLSRATFTRPPPIATNDQSRYGWYAWTDRYATAYASYTNLEAALLVDQLIDDGVAGTGFVRVYAWNSQTGTVATIALWLRYPGL
jgi:prepilin-type N-terminal cleavage/methylation domain-containing protein